MSTNERDRLMEILHQTATADRVRNECLSRTPVVKAKVEEAADAILAAGYRRIFDGDCGLSGIKDLDDREAAEAWMRFSNIVLGNNHDGIGAMKQMLTEFGYRKPRTITTIEELDALPAWSVVRSEQSTIWEKFRGQHTADFWAETMTLGKHPSSHIALPATVLHEPEPQP